MDNVASLLLHHIRVQIMSVFFISEPECDHLFKAVSLDFFIGKVLFTFVGEILFNCGKML